MYIIDTNAIVDIFDRYYCSDVFPALTGAIAAIAAQKKLYIIPEVEAELEANLSEEGLTEFGALNIPCLPETQGTQQKHAEIMAHLSAGHREKLVRSFAAGADALIVAHAVVQKKCIITNERGQYHTNQKLYIPPLARDFGVQSLDTVRFFREEGLRY